MSTLYMHMKKVHRKGKEVPVAAVEADDPPATVSEDGDYVYLVSARHVTGLSGRCLESCGQRSGGGGGAGAERATQTRSRNQRVDRAVL